MFSSQCVCLYVTETQEEMKTRTTKKHQTNDLKTNRNQKFIEDKAP
jgi:hypothetical protein